VINETQPQLYGIEFLHLSGDLSTNTLKLTGRGEIITGENVKVYLLGHPSELLIEDLKVNGVSVPLTFDKEGYFFVAKEKGPFELEGKLNFREIGQPKIYVPGPVNALTFDLRNGYAVDGDQYGLYKKEVVLQRAAKAAILISGAFRYTYAEQDTFLYQLNFKAYGSTLGSFTLPLPNGEKVISVTGALKWEQVGDKLLLDLESKYANVQIRGRFSSFYLRIPLSEERHHVLIESDPEKKLTIKTTAEEIDLSQSPLPPQYNNARAFLASPYDTFTIKIEKLKLKPSLAASVKRAEHRIAITEEGSILGELSLNYANTGKDYLAFEVPGNVLYAATSYKPVKLTSYRKKLFLSLPKTRNGKLELTYFTTHKPLGWVAFIPVPLASTDLPISTAYLNIYLPPEYYVLNTFGVRGGSELPSFQLSILFLIIISGLGWMLKKNVKFTAYYLTFAIALLVFSYYLFLLLIALSILILLHRHIPHAYLKWGVAGLGIILVVVILLLIAGAFFFATSKIGGGIRAQKAMVKTETWRGRALEAEVAPPHVPALAMKGLTKIGETGAPGAITVPTRKGVLPVKLELPRLGKTISLTKHLVTKEKPIKLKILLIHTNLKYLLYLLGLYAGWQALHIYQRRKI